MIFAVLLKVVLPPSAELQLVPLAITTRKLVDPGNNVGFVIAQFVVPVAAPLDDVKVAVTAQ